jgi:hypothetical protein
MLRPLAVFAMLALTVEPALAVDQAAKAFVQGIYRVYETSEWGLDLRSRTQVGRYFTPSTAALIAKDRAMAAKRGDAPRLNSDPFVDAQDWMPTPIHVVVEDGSNPNRAKARASFTYPGSQKKTVIGLDLEKTSAGWRISDIAWQGFARTLRQFLSKGEK